MSKPRRQGLPAGTVIRDSDGRRLIQIVEYPSSDGHYRAYCRICGQGTIQFHTEADAKQRGALHLWTMRTRPTHTLRYRAERSAAEEAESKQLAKQKERCPTPTKKVHKTQEEALEHIRLLYRAGRGNPDLSPYLCKFDPTRYSHGKPGCGFWHVGHSKEHLKKRIKRVVRPYQRSRRRR